MRPESLTEEHVGADEQFALIRENPDGFQSPGTPLTKFVMRSVPHMFALSTSIKAISCTIGAGSLLF